MGDGYELSLINTLDCNNQSTAICTGIPKDVYFGSNGLKSNIWPLT